MALNIGKATATEYAFVLGKIPSSNSLHAVDELRLNIFSVNIPGVSIEGNDFNWQGKHVKYHSGSIDFEPLNVNFIVDVEFYNWKVLYNWITYISDNQLKPSNNPNEYVTDASLIIYNNFGTVNNIITFKNLWIQSIGEVSFSIREGETQIESNATFIYDRYIIK